MRSDFWKNAAEQKKHSASLHDVHMRLQIANRLVEQVMKNDLTDEERCERMKIINNNLVACINVAKELLQTQAAIEKHPAV